ncbi:MAG: OmpA family protein [Myxococcota bacterium]
MNVLRLPLATKFLSLSALLLIPSLAQAAPSAEGKVEIGSKGAKASGKTKGPSEEVLAEREKPWMQRWAPENNELDVGVYGGLFILGENHGLFDQGVNTQPSLRRLNPDIGGRVTYFPIKYLGIGIEGGAMPTRVENGDSRGSFWTFRGHIVGQLPYRITPTLAVGGGILGINSNDPLLQASEGVFHWGPGVKAHINKWLAVRLDGRHIVEGSGNDGEAVNHGEVLLGLDVTLRFKRLGDPNKGRRKDTDGDGVPDIYDSCPDEVGDGDDGCPTERDRDGDGIPDSRDRCPNKWSDNPGGCPFPDDDGDGIMNVDDACPDEAEIYNKFKDKDGCPDERPQELEEFDGVIKGITFASGKAKIRPQSYAVLKRAIRVLNKYPELRIEVSGHTDSVGSHDSNVDLSARRAEAVKKYFVDSGIDASRIETKGLGPDQPIADNDTKAGRAENRRIEFHLLDPSASE